eukprot:765485-Hanusia_phi.AAC.1
MESLPGSDAEEAGQARHSAVPLRGLEGPFGVYPGMHWQLLTSMLPSVAVVMPSGHMLHPCKTCCRLLENLPMGHSGQAARPCDMPYVPEGHSSQKNDPLSAAK